MRRTLGVLTILGLLFPSMSPWLTEGCERESGNQGCTMNMASVACIQACAAKQMSRSQRPGCHAGATEAAGCYLRASCKTGKALALPTELLYASLAEIDEIAPPEHSSDLVLTNASLLCRSPDPADHPPRVTPGFCFL